MVKEWSWNDNDFVENSETKAKSHLLQIGLAPFPAIVWKEGFIPHPGGDWHPVKGGTTPTMNHYSGLTIVSSQIYGTRNPVCPLQLREKIYLTSSTILDDKWRYVSNLRQTVSLLEGHFVVLLAM